MRRDRGRLARGARAHRLDLTDGGATLRFLVVDHGRIDRLILSREELGEMVFLR